MKFYAYQPGNGTRYALWYGKTDGGDDLLVWLHRSDVGGTAFRVPSDMSIIDQDYFLGKTKLENHADSAALLGFLARMGHKVLIFSNHNEKGQWVPPRPAFEEASGE